MLKKLARYIQYKRQYEDLCEHIRDAINAEKSEYFVFGSLDWLLHCSYKLMNSGFKISSVQYLEDSRDMYIVITL